MENLTKEQRLLMLNKLLNTFVKPKFPEIDRIVVKEETQEYFQDWYMIEVISDGIEYEREIDINMEIENILMYVGFEKIRYNLNFTVI